MGAQSAESRRTRVEPQEASQRWKQHSHAHANRQYVYTTTGPRHPQNVSTLYTTQRGRRQRASRASGLRRDFRTAVVKLSSGYVASQRSEKKGDDGNDARRFGRHGS
jgi:hypothetical protein